jgi:endonuclease III
VEDGLLKIVPDKYLLHAHHWLILHGRYVCVARKPLCPICVVRDLCHFPDKTGDETPTKEKAPRKNIAAKSGAKLLRRR